MGLFQITSCSRFKWDLRNDVLLDFRCRPYGPVQASGDGDDIAHRQADESGIEPLGNEHGHYRCQGRGEHETRAQRFQSNLHRKVDERRRQA